MEEVRRNDDMRLRDLIKSKREWAAKERQKGFDLIDKLEEQKNGLTEQQDSIRQQIIKLDGCLLVLDDLIAESNKVEADDKKVKELKAAEEKSKKKTTKRKATKKSAKKS